MVNYSIEKQTVRRFKSYGRFALAIFVLSCMFSHPFLVNKVGHAQAGESDAGHFENFLSGEITSASESTHVLRVKEEEYRVLDNVSITDIQRNPMEWRDLIPSTQILFHLKQGRIDQIIILLPS